MCLWGSPSTEQSSHLPGRDAARRPVMPVGCTVLCGWCAVVLCQAECGDRRVTSGKQRCRHWAGGGVPSWRVWEECLRAGVVLGQERTAQLGPGPSAWSVCLCPTVPQIFRWWQFLLSSVCAWQPHWGSGAGTPRLPPPAPGGVPDGAGEGREERKRGREEQ